MMDGWMDGYIEVR
jgi:hypothetical protein